MSPEDEDLVCDEVSYPRSFVEELERRSMGFSLGVSFPLGKQFQVRKEKRKELNPDVAVFSILSWSSGGFRSC